MLKCGSVKKVIEQKNVYKRDSGFFSQLVR